MGSPLNLAWPLLQPAVAAARQGASFGARIRLPHALVMTLLFQKGSWDAKLRRVVNLALVHARNLALYAATYKGALAALAVAHHATSNHRAGAPRRADPSSSSSSDGSPASSALGGPLGAPAAPWHAAAAGAVGGYLVWGDYSGVNYQITLYVLGRVLVGALRLAAAKGVEPLRRVSFPAAYPFGCAATWAAVMYLWEGHPALLPHSLANSMDAIYRRGDVWRGWQASAVPEAPFLAAAALAALLAHRPPRALQ